ncbi:hypothetical protein O181_038764 [Austropuccinia psidii MF-1]|uniref:Integrase catalytic domain-containing protein n=1 Tax=Austropuccinia psidii MF-1 TaxID=1389203 RepID=A0A9Q3D931_9BASI|nr:hypothetical protein [Austropuccinia psidii MF-1]
MENWHNQKIRKLISDRGGVFLNQKFETLAKECGFVHIFAPPKTPEHNGFAERANCTILEKALFLMNPTNLPNHYWEEAMNTAVFLSNLSTNHFRNNKSPQFLWRNVSPKLSGICMFGCQMVIYNLKMQHNWKLSSLIQEGILLGFENEGTAYRILRLDDLKVVITRNVNFNKRVFPSVPGKTNSAQWTIDELLSPLNTYTEVQTEGDSLTDPQDSLHSASHQENNLEDPNNSDQSNKEQTNQLLNKPSSESLTRCHNNLNNEIDFQNCKELSNSHKGTRVKVIGPRHLTVITSNVDSMHTLLYS